MPKLSPVTLLISLVALAVLLTSVVVEAAPALPGPSAFDGWAGVPESPKAVLLDENACPNSDCAPIVTITKEFADPTATFAPGDDVEFVITVAKPEVGEADGFGPNTAAAANAAEFATVEVTDTATPTCNRASLGPLATGGFVMYNCVAANVTADFSNEACVLAQTADGQPFHTDPSEDCDQLEVVIEETPPGTPSVDIRKEAEGPDSRTFELGSDVTFHIVVTNTGDFDLEQVTVADPLTGNCVRSIGDLAKGASISYDCTAPAVTANFTNEACVTGNTPEGQPFHTDPVTDCDPSTVVITPVSAQIDIEKYVQFLSGGDLCDTLGKPRVLTMEYTGGNTQSHSQASGKVTINDVGPLGLTSQVFIRATDKDDPNDLSGKVWFQGVVNLGDTFDINAADAGQSRLSSDTRVHIFDSTGATLLQSIKFHTSCSQPLALSNQFGGIKLAAFEDEQGGTAQATHPDDADTMPGPSATVGEAVIWTYVVTNTGDVDLTNVSVTDDQGVAVSCPQTDLAMGVSMTCTASGTVVAGPYHNIGTATGEDSAGDVVDDTDPAYYFGVQPVVDQCASGAKPGVLTMEYTGGNTQSHSQDAGKVTINDVGPLGLTSQVFIRATDKDNPNDLSGKVWFQGVVNLGDTFAINAGNAGQSRLSSDTRVHIFDAGGTTLLQSIKFHTSCSQPLFIGNQFGGIELAGFTPEP